MGPGTLRPSPAVPWGSDGGTADQRPRGRGSAECPPLSALKGQSHCVPDLLLSSEAPLSDLLPRARHRTRRAGVPDAQTGPRPREAERLHLVSTRLTGPEADRDPALSSEHVGVCLAGALPPCGHGVCVSCLPVVYRLERLYQSGTIPSQPASLSAWGTKAWCTVHAQERPSLTHRESRSPAECRGGGGVGNVLNTRKIPESNAYQVTMVMESGWAHSW